MFALDACHILQNRGIPFTYEIIGGCSEEMLFQIHQLGLTENVVVKNATPFNQIIKIIQQSDLVILPSVEEGIANVVLEAMALGTPVISTNCGGMPEIIQEGKTGWLVPVRDPEALANKIVHVSRAPAEEINRITAQARRYIENYHQLDGMTEGMINLYNQTIYAES
jgi:colanic acid/amylovoran biosynthesis glycosyltransferase